jgi:hypothetical protein
MKYIITFLLYFALGIFIFASYKEISKIINSQKLTSPLPEITFSLNSAPSESLKANITYRSGRVKWQSRTATQASEIKDKIQIQQGEDVITTDNAKATAEIPDILKIDIEEKSQINFIQTLPENILIEQKEGTVNYEKLDNNQITVRIDKLIIKLINGSIKVVADDESPFVAVDVDGNVTAAFNSINLTTKTIDVPKNKRLIYNKESKTARIVTI